jgi:hypothetical protein
MHLVGGVHSWCCLLLHVAGACVLVAMHRGLRSTGQPGCGGVAMCRHVMPCEYHTSHGTQLWVCHVSSTSCIPSLLST